MHSHLPSVKITTSLQISSILNFNPNFQILVERGHCAVLRDRQRAPHRPQPRLQRQGRQRRRGRRRRRRVASGQERCRSPKGSYNTHLHGLIFIQLSTLYFIYLLNLEVDRSLG